MSDEYDNSYQIQQQQAAFQAEQQRSFDAQVAQQQREADASRAFYEREQQNQQFFAQQAEAIQRRQADDSYAQQQYAQQLQTEQDRLGQQRLSDEEATRRWNDLNQSRIQANEQAFDQTLFSSHNPQFNSQSPWIPQSSSGQYHSAPIDLTAYSPSNEAGANPEDLTRYSPGNLSSNLPTLTRKRSGIPFNFLSKIGVVLLLGAAYLCYEAVSTNGCYVYGKPAVIKVHGHLQKVEIINANQLADSSLYGKMRSLIKVPQKFEFATSVVIEGNIANVELVGPRAIKVIGDVDNCTLITPHGFVSVVGSVENHSVIDAHDLIVTGSISPDSLISR